MAYAYTNTRGITYFLHQDWVTLKGHAAPRPLYYFRKQPGEHAIEAVPEGYEIYEGPRGALPMLRKKAEAGHQ